MEEDKTDQEPQIQDIYSLDTNALLSLFLGILVEKAWQNLGLRVKPGEDKAKVEIDKAKMAIDVSGLLFEKLAPHLPQPEKDRLEGAIGDLKLNYIRVSSQK